MEALEVGESPSVQLAGLQGGFDGAAGLAIVAAVAKSAAIDDLHDVVEQLEDALLAFRGLDST